MGKLYGARQSGGGHSRRRAPGEGLAESSICFSRKGYDNQSMSASPAAEILSLDTPLACACPATGLQLQVSAPDLVLLCCSLCGTIVAGQPVAGEAGPIGLLRLELSEEASQQVRKAASLPMDATLAEVLGTVLACTHPVALRVAQTRLGVRPTLLAELRDALSRTEEPTQFLTLQLVARMPTVPRELRAASLHAIARHLDGDPSGAELAVALTALYAVAESGQHLRQRVERICQKVSVVKGESAAMTLQIARAVLARMDRAAVAAKERYHAVRDQLIELLRKDQQEEAKALLSAAYPEDDPDDPDGGMTARMQICESAAAQMGGSASDQQIRQTLLSWALHCAEIFASWATAGGEGMSRMIDVHRLHGLVRRNH